MTCMTRTLFAPPLVPLTLLLLVTMMSAQGKNTTQANLHIEFQVMPGNAQETLRYTFANPIDNDTLNYTIDKSVTEIKVMSNEEETPFETTTQNHETTITIHAREEIHNLSISFNVDETIYRNKGIYHFFTELALQKGFVTDASARVILPAGYGLIDKTFQPQGGVITSNGQNVIVEWNKLSTQNQPLFFSVKYVQTTHSERLWFGAGFAILLGLCGGLYFYYLRKTEEALLHGFRDDEQKALVYIKEHKEILQKDLQSEFHFSRAKATRIVKKLQEKGMVAKEEWGRTNRVTWTGETTPVPNKEETKTPQTTPQDASTTLPPNSNPSQSETQPESSTTTLHLAKEKQSSATIDQEHHF